MNRHALVVDDDALMVMTMSDILDHHGWEVTRAFNGTSAVDAVRDTDFDVVVMDVRMPDISGVEALRRMKSLRPKLRVVLMTGYSAEHLMDEARELGALRILEKPVDVPDLIGLLDRAMGGVRPVLVVDDDHEFLTSLGDAIEEAGYDVLRAESLDVAMTHLKKGRPAVVVLTLPLDDLQPVDVVATIRDALPSVTFVLYSGSPDILQRADRSLRPNGYRAMLAKPFDPGELVKILDEMRPGAGGAGSRR